MSPDQAIALMADLLRTAAMVAAPLLVAALVAGIAVGILQTATQVNEASISFLVKVATVALVLVVLGPRLAAYVIDYTRADLEAISRVVR